jgi:HSP90 family molecular chaperone
LSELEKVAENDPETYSKIWDNFGAVLKAGIDDDFERRDTLLALSRFKTTERTCCKIYPDCHNGFGLGDCRVASA